MKVRISGNKIRCRLKEPEVAEFEQKGKVSEVLEFGDNEHEKIKFILLKGEYDEIGVELQFNATLIQVPDVLAKEWASTDLVGFNAEVKTSKGKKISILVEKDFMCMDGREEDNAGSYPNPLSAIQ